MLRFHTLGGKRPRTVRFRLAIRSQIPHPRSARPPSPRRDFSPHNVGRRLRLHVIFRRIPNKRAYLAQTLSRTGTLGLIERLASVGNPALLVLTYHRIAEPAIDRFYDPVISATPDALRAQLEWLKHRFRIVTLDELIAGISSGALWKEP